ncbi:MAG: hypothetical protein IJE53_02605 [Bacilli bacterium]|nr:hypothetical protein [Bacilli bacterium]
MNKKSLMVLILFLIFILTGCSRAQLNGIPKGYIDSYEFYEEDGFMDYDDFAFYVYESKETFVNDKNYDKVGKNIEDVKGYFLTLANRLNDDDRLGDFIFDYEIIDENDYVRIKTSEGEPIGDREYGKYDNYDVYFFDVESLTLYYIHSNR